MSVSFPPTGVSFPPTAAQAHPHPTPREQVYLAVNEERDYQDGKWNPVENHQHDVTHWMTYIRDYVEEAQRVLSRFPNEEAELFARHSLRKIAAMAVAAMEQNGVERRSSEGPRAVGERKA